MNKKTYKSEINIKEDVKVFMLPKLMTIAKAASMIKKSRFYITNEIKRKNLNVHYLLADESVGDSGLKCVVQDELWDKLQQRLKIAEEAKTKIQKLKSK